MDIGTPELSITNNSNSHAVRILQEKLNDKGANLYVDGRFSIGTQRALSAFQTEAGIEPSGIATEETWKKLNAKKKAPVKKKAPAKKAPAKKSPAKKTSPKAKKK